VSSAFSFAIASVVAELEGDAALRPAVPWRSSSASSLRRSAAIAAPWSFASRVVSISSPPEHEVAAERRRRGSDAPSSVKKARGERRLR
jgi:hypothetical protein